MPVPVEMRVPAASIHVSSSSSSSINKRLFMLPRSLSERSSSSKLWRHLKNNSHNSLLRCIPPIQMTTTAGNGNGILCDEACNGKGWLICDFCQGQKTNVKANNNRLYRRCPSCKAIGYILCPKCKVFKCVTFPNDDDNGDGSEG